jgi:hypothetical protein
MASSHTGVSPSTSTGGDRLGPLQQLLQAKEEAIRIELGPAVAAAHPGAVVQSHRQQDALGALAAQFAAAGHLGLQPCRHPFESVAAHAQGVEHRPIGQLHPVAPQPLTPAPLLGVAPAVHAAVTQHDQLAGGGRRGGRHGAGGGRWAQ